MAASKTKTVKAWAVIVKSTGEVIEPLVSVNSESVPAARVAFLFKKDIPEQWLSDPWCAIRCTITFTIPTKAKVRNGK